MFPLSSTFSYLNSWLIQNTIPYDSLVNLMCSIISFILEQVLLKNIISGYFLVGY